MSGYIGTQPVPQATQTRDSFTATSGQTSFATGGYTPNFLDIFLNGVKLAAADYTASNGSDVVLASGAATGDILEVVAFTTFTPANIPSGTPSIDDNGNATALTIDSSENVLVGKTSSSTTTAGNELRAGGLAAFTRSGSYSLNLNRLASDGDIAVFQKDNTTVGRIGSNGTASWIACPAGSGAGLRFDGSDNRIVPTEGDGTNRNAAVDLGYSSSRFKDLYLSGGVYLGGTGSANKLDDFEEGTWTPTIIGSSSAGTMTYPDRVGRYQKVGRLVTIHFYIQGNSGSGSGNLLVGGVPFTIANYHLGYGSPQWNNGITYPSGAIDANYLRNSSTTFDIRCNKSNSAFANVQYPTTPDYLRGCITYETTQ